jgi:hypothetical protein
VHVTQYVTVTLTRVQARVTWSCLAALLNDPDWWGSGTAYTLHEAAAADRAVQAIRKAMEESP